ncbi:MAG: hypothetical protein WDO13_20265 [Verrucomicrobiota bacterium]
MRQAVFDTVWTTEDVRDQYVKWCRDKAFEKIALIEGMIAAAFVTGEGKLAGWCANSVISPENLCFIAETCRGVLSANRAEQRPAHTGVVAFGNRTLVFREGPPGLFLAYLDSPVNDAVLAWLFAKVNPLLADEGVKLE